ncbi:Rv3654c family TadE-like protein [Ornithinimicrobium cerasi]|uniref:Rv3654c family TadE-like protein n=1 Tax=Ornithinimicrobium cerasi TaxID=2248773 RepID=UPI000EFFF7F5|nr:Rv3654c family TadE-like protein [Ornithinimicrobium cerasi]
MSRDGGPERGSGTVLAVGLVAVVSTLLLAGLLVAAVAVAGQQARTAADLAALAAAGQVVHGGDEPTTCAVARQVAERNGGGLTGCSVVGPAKAEPGPLGTVEVVVTRPVAGTAWEVTARARAGGVLPP